MHGSGAAKRHLDADEGLVLDLLLVLDLFLGDRSSIAFSNLADEQSCEYEQSFVLAAAVVRLSPPVCPLLAFAVGLLGFGDRHRY